MLPNDFLHEVRRDQRNPVATDFMKLKALGLTNRQAEVAFWVSQGKTNNELATIVSASPRTIAHHIETILARLRLSTRAEIMLCVLEALGWLRWPTRQTNGVDLRPNRKTEGGRRSVVGNPAHIQCAGQSSQSSGRRGKIRRRSK